MTVGSGDLSVDPQMTGDRQARVLPLYAVFVPALQTSCEPLWSFFENVCCVNIMRVCFEPQDVTSFKG